MDLFIEFFKNAPAIQVLAIIAIIAFMMGPVVIYVLNGIDELWPNLLQHLFLCVVGLLTILAAFGVFN